MERTEIESKYKWNLSHIYNNNEEWVKDKQKIESEITKISSFKGKLNESYYLYLFVCLPQLRGNFLTKLEAEALLSGITLDTKNFNFKTGVRTFEAAATLRKRGADPTSVKKLFQGDFDNFLSKAEVIKNVKIIGNKMALSVCPDDVVNPQLVIAQGADELLNVKGVRASIVLGQGEDDVIFVSARSLGDINVQVLMEKLNGGGHIDVAGAQLKDVSMDEALEQVEELIIDYLKEES